MKLKQGEKRYDLPPYGVIKGVQLERYNHQWVSPLVQTSLEELERLRARISDLQGTPTHFALDDYDGLWLFPTPNHEEDLSVYYYPPLKIA